MKKRMLVMAAAGMLAVSLLMGCTSGGAAEVTEDPGTEVEVQPTEPVTEPVETPDDSEPAEPVEEAEPVDYSGTYTEPPTGRSLIGINKVDDTHYSISVIWANSADETAYWDISDAAYSAATGTLEYTGAKYYIRTYTGEDEYTDDVKYTDGTGRFSLNEDGTLSWNSDNADVDMITGDVSFEKR